jgi:hypothetical protein
MILIRYYDPEYGAQLGIQHDNAVYRLSGFALLSSWLRVSIGHVNKAIEELERLREENVPALAFHTSPMFMILSVRTVCLRWTSKMCGLPG